MSNIRVALRVRPLNEKEKDEGSTEIVRVNNNSVRIENVKVLGIPEYGDSRSRVREFLFDHCYNCMQGDNDLSSQAKVFNDLGADVLKAAYGGFNACLFAYGQTGTGKTHTMMGYPGDVGLIPRICEDVVHDRAQLIVKKLGVSCPDLKNATDVYSYAKGLLTHKAECTDENVTSRIDVSYFEIYNERVRDLLQPQLLKLNENYSLKIREHPKEGPYVKDLSWHRVKNNEDIQALLDKGNEYRVTAETYMHGHSSRSHAIVTICYTQARLEENRPSEIVSKINLVDLAGSERADPSSKPDFRKRLTEGANINKSLVTLGYVIKALAERCLLSWATEEMGSTQSFSSSGGGETVAGSSPANPNKQRVPYIPYRDSVLTWLLKDSLGGNSKTIMIATITPASQYYNESISTLRYAQRAKNIINKPRINEDSNVALIRELKREIERLHGMLATAQMPATQLGSNYLPGDIVYFVPSLHKGPDDPDGQGGNLVTLPESEDCIIAEKLHENEEMAKQLTQSWMCKWSSTHDIMKESDLSIRGLRNRSSSMGVMIDSQLPYLIGMDDDVLSTGIVIFHLKEGDTLVGRMDADTAQDIVLHGPTIQKDHCVIQHVNGEVYLHPCPGAMCAVQDIECTEPTKLSQGDYVILGGNQVFRFNNPSEAAKLRENRRSQGSLNTLHMSHLSFGGLSRASSYSSLGGDDSHFLSPPSQLSHSYPNSRRRHSDIIIYAAPDLCRDLEKRYQTEQERIAEASKELERLKEEHERAEELRQLKEEEMYQTHEQHRADIEEQKCHLARLIEENERERAKAEEELRLARESLAREKDAFQKQLEEERRKLKELQRLEQQQESMAIQTEPLSTQTASVGCEPSSTQSTSVGSDSLSTQGSPVGSASTATASTSADGVDGVTDLPVIFKGGRRLSASDQLDELAQAEFSRRMSYRETEESLAIQQEDIEDAYFQTQEQLEDKLRKIEKIEEEYKEVDKAHLQEIAAHTEMVKEIVKKEAQLEVYIQENEELSNVCQERPRPLRSACSEMFLLDPNIQDQEYSQKTASLLDIQGDESENQDQLSIQMSPLRRASSAESLESGIGEISKDMDGDRKMAQKDKKISNAAKQVTSRLYQAPKPKFKYVPKIKEKEVKTIPRTKTVRDRQPELKSRMSPVKHVKEFDRSKSESPKRVNMKRTSPSPARDIESKKGTVSASRRGQKLKEGPKPKISRDERDKQEKNDSKVMNVRNKAQGPNRTISPSSTLSGAGSPTSRASGAGSSTSRVSETDSSTSMGSGTDSPTSMGSGTGSSTSRGTGTGSSSSRASGNNSPSSRVSEDSSPTSRLSGAVSPISRLSGAGSPERLGVVTAGIVRTPSLRHMASASSLASVPESLAENEESSVNESQKDQISSYGVKKRQKKGRANFIDENFRCHSAPDSQKMSQALDQYTDEMNFDLQHGYSNSERIVPLVATSVSVDDSHMYEEVEEKISDKENESDGVDPDIRVNEICVDLEPLDSDIEMKETAVLNEHRVDMYISSGEESKGIDDTNISQDIKCTDTVNSEDIEDLDASMGTEDSTVEASVSISLVDDFTEASEHLVAGSAETIIEEKRGRKPSDKSQETYMQTEESRSVSDGTDSLCDVRSNKAVLGVNIELDAETFSEDSLDLNISIDSLEDENHISRLTQSLPASLIRSENPMYEDSLSDSCDEQKKNCKDTPENYQSEKGTDPTLGIKEEQITDTNQTSDLNSLPNSNIKCHETTVTLPAFKMPKLTKVSQEPIAFLPHDDKLNVHADTETLTQLKEIYDSSQSSENTKDFVDKLVDTGTTVELNNDSKSPVMFSNITSCTDTDIPELADLNQIANEESSNSKSINAKETPENEEAIVCNGNLRRLDQHIDDRDLTDDNISNQVDNNIPVDMSQVRSFVSDIINHAQEINHENLNDDTCLDNLDEENIVKNKIEINSALGKFLDGTGDVINDDLEKSVTSSAGIKQEIGADLNRPKIKTENNFSPTLNNNLNVVVANICNEMQNDVNNLPSQKDNEVNEESEQIERSNTLESEVIEDRCGTELNTYINRDLEDATHQLDSLEHDKERAIADHLSEQCKEGNVINKGNEGKLLNETKEPFCQGTTDVEITNSIETVRNEMDTASVSIDDVDSNQNRDSDTEQKEEKHGYVVDENHNVVRTEDESMGDDLAETALLLNTQNVVDESISNNYTDEQVDEPSSTEKTDGDTASMQKNVGSLNKEELTASTPVSHETGNESANELESEENYPVGNRVGELNAIQEKPGEHSDDSEMSSVQNKNTEMNENSLKLKNCNRELPQPRNQTSLEHASSSLSTTRSIGVGTSEDLLEGLGDIIRDNLSQGSNDSFLLDPREELQVLQEALEKLPAKSGPQLSAARLAARQRAMIRQQHRCADSDGVAQLSDEASLSGTQTKNSSPPGSGSRRRKRPSSKTACKTTKHLKDHTSDDYDSSENDSVYSDDSVDAVRLENYANGDVNNGYVFSSDLNDDLDFAERCETTNMLSRPKHNHHGHVHHRPDFTEIVDGPDGRRTIGIQTYDHSLRNRSTGSTRTDISDFDGSFVSEGRGMVLSPLSLWNSNERSSSESQSDHNSTSSAGFIKNLNDIERSLTPTPRSSTRSNASVFSERSNLEKGPTEVWSSSSSELRPLPSFRDDLSYIIETEGLSPGASLLDYTEDARSQHSSVYIRTPREGEQLILRPDCSTPTNSGRVVNISFPESQLQHASNLDDSTPVKFEVTVHEDNTNIEYNVEKTEYKTYSLRNRNEPSIIPDRILVNLTENVNTKSQENYKTEYKEEVTMHQPDNVRPPEDSLVLEKSVRLSSSSERETEVDNEIVKRDESKELKDERQEESYYRMPSKSIVRKNEMKLQHSGVVEATNYPSTFKGTENVNTPEESETCEENLRGSLNESDYTSDYGTITSIDGRKGHMSFTSDSDDSDSIVISPRPSHLLKQKSVKQSDIQHTPYLPLQSEITEMNQSAMIIPEQSQNICPSTEENTNITVAGTQENSALTSNIVQRSGLDLELADEAKYLENKLADSELGHDIGPTSDLGYESTDVYTENGKQIEEDMETDNSSVDTVTQVKAGETENFPSQETIDSVENQIGYQENVEKDTSENFQQLDPVIPKLDLTQTSVTFPQRKLSVSSTDEMYLSMEQSESNTSTCSSDYKTPQQSPREHDEIKQISKEVDDVIIPDFCDDKLQTTPRQEADDISVDQIPILTSSPKQSDDVRTVSVNTESVPSTTLSAPPAVSRIRHIFSSPVHTETLRKDLENKIAKLKRDVRSLSDSAISSDFTDGDCSSLSPRGSRVYDDKSFLGEKRPPKVFRNTPTRVKQTLYFEGSLPTKVAFKDSGNVFDDEGSSIGGEELQKERPVETLPPLDYFLPSDTQVGKFPERIIDALLAIKPQPLQRCNSLDSLSAIINLEPHLARAVREFKSIEDIPSALAVNDETKDDSKIKKDNALMLSDGARPLSPGEIGMEQDSIDDMYAEIEKENIVPNANVQVEASHNRKISEKSTSMSVLGDTLIENEYHRSLSEGNIDDFSNENDISDTSNDSITFVFIKDDRTKLTSEYDHDSIVLAKGVEGYDPCGSGELYNSESESIDSRQESGAWLNFHEAEEANISGRGPLCAKSEDIISDVLSASGSEHSVIEYNQINVNAEEDEVSSHTASEEIEQIIYSHENLGQTESSRNVSVSLKGDSPTYTDTSDSFVQDKGKHYDDDSEPLRHKFGIDESILPIPERSVSADNIPKHLTPLTDLMRSRSTGMLDVGVAVEPESESGIFPPALRSDDDPTEQSVSLHTMSEGGLDHISRRTFSDMEASLSNRTSGDVDSENYNSEENSSAVVRSICSRSSSVESLEEQFTIDFKTNWNKHKPRVNHSRSSEDEAEQHVLDEEQQLKRVLETVQRLIFPKPFSVDRGVNTESETESNFISTGVQTIPSESSTEVTGNLQSVVRADQIILPALAAPFRAQSMDSFGLGANEQGLELSEESRNWCTLGELMVETTHLLRRINDRLPEQSRKGSDTGSSSEDSQVSQVIFRKWQEISIQTGHSIENLTTVGSQTDGDEAVTQEGKLSQGIETFAESKPQDKTKLRIQRLDMSDMVTYDLLPLGEMTDDMSVNFSVCEQEVEPSCVEVITNDDNLAMAETINLKTEQKDEMTDKLNQQEVLPYPDKNVSKNTDSKTESTIVQSVAPVSFSHKEQQLKENQSNETIVVSSDAQIGKGETKTTAKYIPQIKADLGLDDMKNDVSDRVSETESSQRQETTIKSPYKLLQGFTLPDTPEIAELRKEHTKLMENLRKASDERSSRKERLQARKKSNSPDVSFGETLKEKSLLKQPTTLQDSHIDRKEDTQFSNYGVETIQKSKVIKINKNDPESTSSNSSVIEDNVRSDGEEKEQVSEIDDAEDILRSDDDDKVASLTEDAVRSDGDDEESVFESERLDEMQKHDKNATMGSRTSPIGSQEFVQINIQVDPSSGITVNNKTVREPRTKRNTERKETDKGENIREEHIWEIAGDKFSAVWDRRPESRSRTESNNSLDTIQSTEMEEDLSAGALKDVPENAMAAHSSCIDDGNISNVEIIEDVLENDIKVQDHVIDKDDGRESPASVIEDLIHPKSYTREEHVPSLIERISVNEALAGLDKNRNENDSNIQLSTRHVNQSQESLLEQTIVPQKHKRECSLLPAFLKKSTESVSELEPESVSVDDPRERGPKIQQNISKSETSPKYKAQILREQQRQAASPYFAELAELHSEDKVPHQQSARKNHSPLEDQKPFIFTEDKDIKSDCPMHETEHQITPSAYRTEPRLLRFFDDATQVSMQFSDDCTQTDMDLPYDQIISPDADEKIYSQDKSATYSSSPPSLMSKEAKSTPEESPPGKAKTAAEFKEELESLQHERQHIMDLLGLSYLPNSLTVELLEAKLNHCIGQTDLLLDNLENTSEPDESKKTTVEQKQAKDYISKYRADLKKSKEDIKECREQINKGRGRGRPSTRGRTHTRRSDVLNHQRQAEIDAFKLERLREQQDYEKASRHGTPSRSNTPLRGNTPLKGNTPLYGNSPAATPRSDRSRSSSPAYSPSYMNPREHKAHLVDLRRQLIKDVVEEERQHSRSCSPFLHTSPPAVQKYRSPSEQSLGFSPKVSVSLSDIPGSPTSSSPSSDGSKTYVVAPGSSSLSPVRRPPSHDSRNPYGSYQSSPDRSYVGRRTSPSLDRKMVAESIFSPQESEKILQEIEEYKKCTQISAPMEELLRRSSYSSSSSQRSSSSRPDFPGFSPRSQSDPRLPGRSSTSPVARQLDTPLSLNLDCLQDDEAGPYSPYSAYAREHIIANERSPPGGVLRGTFELYHDRSDTSSVLSYDSDTFSDTGSRQRHNTLDEETIKRLRPIRAEDIKARINRHKR